MVSSNLESMINTARSILKNEIKHLPLVPSVALKLVELTADINVDFSDLSHIIETEPSLAIKILRNVNSPVYAISRKVTSIRRAVTILGYSTVRQLAIDLLFYDHLIKNKFSSRFDSLFFWQHCLFVALLSKKIAIALKHPNPDLIYTAGLIHDIGKIILETYGRLTYSDFISTIHNSENLIIEDERRFFGMSHSEIGYVFCKEWHLPESITAVIACHHNFPAENSPFAEFKTEIAIVSFANYVAWMQGLSSVKYQGNPVLQSSVLEAIQFELLDIDFLLRQVDQEMQHSREFYGIQFPSVTKLRAALVRTTVNLSQFGVPKESTPPAERLNKLASSLTVPHHSLNPKEFVPNTLEVIQTECGFDRCIMLAIDPKHRCLKATYCWPLASMPQNLHDFKIEIKDITGRLLQCLREKMSVIITQEMTSNRALLQQFGATECLIIPVLNHNRVIGLIYSDNINSKKPLTPVLIPEILPIANELGIALLNATQYERQKKSAQLDPLTQLFNKRMIEEHLTQVFTLDKVHLSKIAIGFIDIDKFKLFNDLCGHQVGDDVLKIVADILRSLTRPGDFIGRYGGEEFIFVLRNTDKAGAFGYAERIRCEIERRGKLMSQRFHEHALTASIGVAMYHPNYRTHLQMIDVADQSMYQAKKQGRNKVVLFTDIPEQQQN